MTIEITEHEHSVTVEYQADTGETARVVIVGRPVSEVRDDAEQIVNDHNLKTKAEARS